MVRHTTSLLDTPCQPISTRPVQEFERVSEDERAFKSPRIMNTACVTSSVVNNKQGIGKNDKLPSGQLWLLVAI